ncbi:MAG: GNAT family N-acetyltransferase [Candidatus Latescibacteria bacterium]|jgi:mycothiol synthase|nr:GNAT family N-acetyltransferase [Candidatus Latescibacterota bacterium]
MLQWLKSLFKTPPPKSLPQLEMFRDNLNDLPAIQEIADYDVRTFQPGDEAVWCQIMEGNVGSNWTEESCRTKLTEDPRFKAENLFFIIHNDEAIASTCAWHTKDQAPDTGTVHMVAALPGHRGKGLGHLLNALVLHRLKDLGYQKSHLKTDDWRLPAIKTYLNAGFAPLNTHESHPERWDKIFSELGVET